MNEPIKYISKVEIKNLWGRYDLEWNLDPSVNILSGINGSGKSTVLDCIGCLTSLGKIPEPLRSKISGCNIYLNNDEKISFERQKRTIEDIELEAERNPLYKTILSQIQLSGNKYSLNNNSELEVDNIVAFSDKKKSLEDFTNQLMFNVIATFDQWLEQGVTTDEKVKTVLDKDIFDLQKKYLDYQLNLGKKAFDIVSKNGKDAHNEVVEVKKQHNRFLEIIDMLFADTDKRVDRDNNELMFLSGKDKLTPYQLSSGEKQMLVILMTVLVEDNKPSVLFMDEPEISLHLDWQRKLIQYIKELNPNVQIILATHSPGIILEGWADKVSEMSDLITLDRQAKLENAK